MSRPCRLVQGLDLLLRVELARQEDRLETVAFALAILSVRRPVKSEQSGILSLLQMMLIVDSLGRSRENRGLLWGLIYSRNIRGRMMAVLRACDISRLRRQVQGCLYRYRKLNGSLRLLDLRLHLLPCIPDRVPFQGLRPVLSPP